MPDSLQPCAPSIAEGQSEEVKRNKPPPVQTYEHQIRSLLGKRNHGEEETKSAKRAATIAGSSHLPAPDALGSRNVDDVDELDLSPDNGSIFTLDGTVDKGSRRWGKPVTAIFIHAGAGYHSTANEEHHLKACSE